ncbi:hypothetical protein D3C80_844780 [compost metagenome]
MHVAHLIADIIHIDNVFTGRPHDVGNCFVGNGFTLAAHVQIILVLGQVVTEFLRFFSPRFKHGFRHDITFHFAVLFHMLFKPLIQRVLRGRLGVFVFVQKHFRDMRIFEVARVLHQPLGCRFGTVTRQAHVGQELQLLFAQARVFIKRLFLGFQGVETTVNNQRVFFIGYVFTGHQHAQRFCKYALHVVVINEWLRLFQPLFHFGAEVGAVVVFGRLVNRDQQLDKCVRTTGRGCRCNSNMNVHW